MSGGSQHNPNGRQSQLGSGWSPLQLQVANLLARAPQAHMASDRGVTWHTPTPPPHLYHVPAPSPPDPLQALSQLQAMKAAGGNALYRHTGTPPDIYHRHTPTPPDKHHMRHTPSPGDIKASAALPPVDLYQHLGPGRDKLVRPEELLAYARVGVDLSLSGGRAANGAPPNVPVSTSAPATPPVAPALSVRDAPALSVRDAPTINSLIARAQPRLPHARVDALLERLAPSPVSPHSVIVHSRVAPTPSPPSSNEDSADSCGAPPGSKRKRKPERTLRVAIPPAPVAPPSLPVAPPPEATPTVPAPPTPEAEARVSPPPVQAVQPPAPLENGDATHVKVNGPCDRSSSPAQSHARRKTRSGSAETLADIAAMVAAPAAPEPPLLPPPAVSVDKLRSVLAGPTEPTDPTPSPPPRVPTPPTEPPPAAPASPPSEPTVAAPVPPGPQSPVAEVAAGVALAPRRRSARAPLAEAANVPVESPSEAVPAEPEASAARTAEPAAASFVEVENQLEKMFAGIEEEPRSSPTASRQGDTSVPNEESGPPANRKRRRSAPPHRRSKGPPDSRKKPMRKKIDVRKGRKGPKDGQKDAYDSGSNASSSRSRGPYIQIRGPRDSPLSVSVMNNTGGDDEDCGVRRKGEEFRPRGLHASTLGLRYDATTPDATWLCAFCRLGPHAEGLGDLFGPYALHTDCDEYRALDEATRRRYSCEGADEVWFHEACGVWAPGLVAAGARVWGLAGAVWGARGARCLHCHRAGAALACAKRACRARAHLPCAVKVWTLHHEEFRALCPHHAPT